MSIYIENCPHIMEGYIARVCDHLGLHGIVEIEFHEGFIGAEGFTHGDDEIAYIDISLLDYNNHRYDEVKLKRIVAHELVHAHQYLSGRLSQENFKYTFDGELYEEYDCATSPWEVEAYELEKQLIDMFA